MKLAKKILTGIDYAAFGVSFVALSIAAAGFVIVAIIDGLRFVAKQFDQMIASKEDRWLLVALAASVIWCAFRWKALNRTSN
jgi:hypothetical protein